MVKKSSILLISILLILLPLCLSFFVVARVNAGSPIGSNNITLYSIADTFVNSTSPETNYGNTASMYVGANSEQDFTYVKFDLTSIPSDATVTSANLEIYLSDTGGNLYWSPADTIGAYYCSDNSWTELGITWNNKPNFNPNPTGSWSFGMLDFTGYKLWDVTADVKTALTSGTLTEVLKFESKTGNGYALYHSKEGASRPKLTVTYSTEPVCSVNFESVQDTGTTHNLGLTTLASQEGGYTHALPAAIDVVVGNYQVKYSGGYLFMRWETSGGVTVSDANAASTTMTVSDGGTLKAVGNVKQLEYTYDREYSILHPGFYESQDAGKIGAVRFTPLFSGQLLTARFYIYYTSYTPNAFRVHVMDENRQDIITPFERTPTSKGWFEIDLSSYGISVNDGTDFYIGMEWLVDSYPNLGADDTWTVSDRSWIVTGMVWEESVALTIRAVVGEENGQIIPESTILDHVIVADGIDFCVTTESNSTLSNCQFNRDAKELLFNVAGTTSNYAFCNFTIPNGLLGGPFSITRDEQTVSEVISSSNSTHTWLHFTYPQNTNIIKITGNTVIPEFSSWIILPLFLTVTLAAIIIKKKIENSHS